MKKRKKILILLIIFFLTSTFYPHELKNKFYYKFKFFNLETINIQSNQNIYNNIVRSKLKSYYGQNLLFLEKDLIINNLREIDFIENIKIAKKLPNELIVIFEEIIPVALYEKNSEKFLISSSGKLVKIANHKKYNDLPQVYQMDSVEEFVIFYSMLREAKFPIDLIKNFIFYKIGRWDLELSDETIVKLPSANVNKSLKKLNLLFKSGYLGNVNLIDLRVENQIITE
tara:strand:+ start:159 stop:842 length:684 start_codon:yes stop_codon:yes gene_type:complete